MPEFVLTPPLAEPNTRGLVTEALTERGRVLGGTVVDDGGGGGAVTSVLGDELICRIDALGGGEGEVANRISDRSTHLVTLPAGTSVATDNDFSITGRGTFEITAVREHTGEFARFIEVVPRS